MPKEQFNVSIEKQIKRGFAEKCDGEGRDYSKIVQILMKAFVDCQINISWKKNGGTILSIKK